MAVVVEAGLILDFAPATHTYKVIDIATGRERILPSVTQVLSSAGLIDTTWFTDGGTERGKNVHIATQYDDEGDLDENTLDPTYLPYLKAWRRFKLETGFLIEAIEKPFYNLEHGFAGTIDRVGILNGRRVVADIKTGQIQKWWPVQVAGYSILSGVDENMTVRLKDCGSYKVYHYDEPEKYKDVFVAALAINKFKEM